MLGLYWSSAASNRKWYPRSPSLEKASVSRAAIFGGLASDDVAAATRVLNEVVGRALVTLRSTA